jgi:hydrogenase expression/formation protein HypC
MCLAIPMRITAIEGKMATIEVDGLSQRASLLLLPSAEIGDYVLVHAGCAITVLSEEDAQETLDLLAEIGAFQAELDRPEDERGD